MKLPLRGIIGSFSIVPAIFSDLCLGTSFCSDPRSVIWKQSSRSTPGLGVLYCLSVVLYVNSWKLVRLPVSFISLSVGCASCHTSSLTSTFVVLRDFLVTVYAVNMRTTKHTLSPSRIHRNTDNKSIEPSSSSVVVTGSYWLGSLTSGGRSTPPVSVQLNSQIDGRSLWASPSSYLGFASLVMF